VIRNSDTQLLIIVPPLARYSMPPLGGEIIAATNLPSSAVSSLTDVTAKLGPRALWIRARTAIYEGTFFPTNKTDENIQLSTTYTIKIRLVASRWEQDLVKNGTKRQPLIDAVLSSVLGPTTKSLYPKTYTPVTEEDYKDAMALQRQNYPPTAVVRVDNRNIVITVIQMPDYVLPAGGKEMIYAGPIPAEATVDLTDIKLQIGDATTWIAARTLHIGGTFFSDVPKMDLEIRAGQNLTIVLDLLADEWVEDVATEAFLSDSFGTPSTQKQLFVDSILASSNASTAKGYELAFATQIQNFPTASVVRASATQVVITIPPFPSYQLPGCAVETIAASYLSNKHVKGLTAIARTLGVKTTAIAGRVSPPTFTPNSIGPHISSVEVTIHTCADARGNKATAYFSLDGRSPVVKYTQPFWVYRISTIRAYGKKEGHEDSLESNMNYTIQAAPPVFCPLTGSFAALVESITMLSSTPDVSVHYTTDGTQPSTSSAKLVAATSLDWTQVGSFEFRSVAARSGVLSSAISVAYYNVTPGKMPTKRTQTPKFEIDEIEVFGGVVLQGSSVDIVVPSPDDDAILYWTAQVGEWSADSGVQPIICDRTYDTSDGTWKTGLPGRVSVQFAVAAGKSVTIKAISKKDGLRLGELKVGTFLVETQNQFEMRSARSKVIFKTKTRHKDAGEL